MKQTDKKKYHHIHHWMKLRYGKANICENPSCNKKSIKYNWALKHGHEYKKDRRSFIMLCVSCHRKYDITSAFRASKCKKVKSIDINGKETVYKSLSAASYKTKTIITGISNVLAGRAKTSNNLMWLYV